MRYTVDQNYLFINVDFTVNELRFGSSYLPWTDTLNKITIRNLTCKEHHKVPGEFDPEDQRVHDGFIFQEENQDEKWSNQYPVAAYSQTSTECDNLVITDKVNENSTLNSISMVDLAHHLQGMIRGIQELRTQNSDKEAESLLQHFNVIEQKVKDEFKMKMIITGQENPWRKVTFVPM